jgi:uncharacterized protein
MCPLGKRVTTKGLPFRGSSFAAVFRVVAEAILVVIGLFVAGQTIPQRSIQAENAHPAKFGYHKLEGATTSFPAGSMRDSRGDGFPDGARLDNAHDRENFTHWFTFFAETQYYSRSPRSKVEVQDCAALIRYAFRNSLVAHSSSWRKEADLPYDPGFDDVTKYHYPYGPLGQTLFRRTPGPFATDDVGQGAFTEFADSVTLLRYNTYLISRDIRAAAPGDLLFFHQAVEREPFHTMLFVGRSYFQQLGADWIVYHTGDIDGHRGEVREVQAATLLQHPDLHWRPLMSNPNFLGVYRLEILR